MKERDRIRAERLDVGLTTFAARVHDLPGIADPVPRGVLLQQLIDSLHRVEYPRRLLARRMSQRRTDPEDSEYFDPVRAAVHYRAISEHDEACWLVFLFVAYGKSAKHAWRLIRDVYDRLGKGERWDWRTVASDPTAFEAWIAAHAADLSPRGMGGFGNHRKFESVAATGRTAITYVGWVGPQGHRAKFDGVAAANDYDRRRTFDALYRSMNEVWRFGRLARFDYLTMLGKLDLAPIEPGSTYMTGATGPVSGARLLLGDAAAGWEPSRLDQLLIELGAHLALDMQVLEDALCNWQKSPASFKRFRG